MSHSELSARALGDHMFPRYVELKRAEWEDYRVQVSPSGSWRHPCRC